MVERKAGRAVVGQLVDHEVVVAADNFARRSKKRGLGEAEIASASDELRRLDEVAYGDRAVQFDEFQRAYAALLETLAPFAERIQCPEPAYYVVDDNVGTRELLVEVLDPAMDWEEAKRSIAISFSERFPLWSVILRMPGAPDERIG